MSEQHFFEQLIPDVTASLARIEAALKTEAELRPGEIRFANASVNPPTQFYVTHGMQLRLRSVTSQAAEVLRINAQILVDSRLVTIALNTPAFAALDTTTERITTTGFLVMASVTCTVATRRGQTFCTLELLDQTGNFLCSLFSGYVVTGRPISYPPIFIEDPLSGYGNPVMPAITVQNALDLRWTVPANRVWKIQHAYTLVTTVAGGGNRWINLWYRYIAQAFAVFPGLISIPAATPFWAFAWGKDVVNLDTSASPTSPTLIQPLSESMIPGNAAGDFDIYITLQNTAVGDNIALFNICRIVVEEYLTL